MQQSELEKHRENLKCSFCRNSMLQSEKVNIIPNEGEFVGIMCDQCNERFKDNPQLGPKFLICLCADKPRELDLSMSKVELEIIKKQMAEEKSGKKRDEGFKAKDQVPEGAGTDGIPKNLKATGELNGNEVSTLQAKRNRNIST